MEDYVEKRRSETMKNYIFTFFELFFMILIGILIFFSLISYIPLNSVFNKILYTILIIGVWLEFIKMSSNYRKKLVIV